jgi:hypothetical protein
MTNTSRNDVLEHLVKQYEHLALVSSLPVGAERYADTLPNGEQGMNESHMTRQALLWDLDLAVAQVRYRIEPYRWTAADEAEAHASRQLDTFSLRNRIGQYKIWAMVCFRRAWPRMPIGFFRDHTGAVRRPDCSYARGSRRGATAHLGLYFFVPRVRR